jgi:uncharacterized membrane protein YczE
MLRYYLYLKLTASREDSAMRRTLTEYLLYVCGILILTLGIALTILSKMGTSPFDALLVGLFRTVGLTIGSWEIILGGVLVLFNAVALRRRPEFLALLTAFITGIGIDLWLFLLRDWLHPETLIGQTSCLIFGMVLVGIGVAAYLQANIAPIPMDRSMLVVQELTGLSVILSRALINIVLVALAFIFNGPIGIGTLIITFFGGVFIKFFMPYAERVKNANTGQQKSVSS